MESDSQAGAPNPISDAWRQAELHVAGRVLLLWAAVIVRRD
jgi:hypothetical protein